MAKKDDDKKQKPFNPSAGDTPQARSAAKVKGALRATGGFISNVGGFIADSAATAGNTGVMGNTRDLPSAGFQTPQDQGLRGAPTYGPTRPTQAPNTGVIDRTKPANGNTATDSTPVQTSTDATAPPGTAATNNVSALRSMGVQHPDMPAVGGGQTGRRAVIAGGSNGFVNLGDPAQEGGPNIYGKSSAPGGRMDTFVGAGPNAGTNEAGQVLSTGANGQPGVYNPTGYDPSNPYGGAATRRPTNSSLRAGQTQFGRGGGGVKRNELRRINQQANRAFNNALESGMNTKAALRISQSIRAGGDLLSNQDKNDASRYGADQRLAGAQYASDASTTNTALREQGYMSRANAAAGRQAQQAQFDIFADQFVDEEGKPDRARVSRMVQNAGGLERFMNASPDIQQQLGDRGSWVSQVLDNVNQVTGKDGTIYSTLGALSGGARLPKSDATIVDAFTSGNIDMIDAIFGADKFELPDGTLVEADDVLKGVDRETILQMSPEDRRDFIALTGE